MLPGGNGSLIATRPSSLGAASEPSGCRISTKKKNPFIQINDLDENMWFFSIYFCIQRMVVQLKKLADASYD